jgi:hypothetical protein
MEGPPADAQREGISLARAGKNFVNPVNPV